MFAIIALTSMFFAPNGGSAPHAPHHAADGGTGGAPVVQQGQPTQQPTKEEKVKMLHEALGGGRMFGLVCGVGCGLMVCFWLSQINAFANWFLKVESFVPIRWVCFIVTVAGVGLSYPMMEPLREREQKLEAAIRA